MAVETIKTQNNPSVHFDINMISIQVRQWIRKTMKYRNSNNKLLKIINQKFFHKLSSIFFFFVSVMATEVFYDLTKEVASTSGLLLSKSDLFVWLCGCVRVCGVHPLHPQRPQEVAVESVDQLGHAERDSMGHFFRSLDCSLCIWVGSTSYVAWWAPIRQFNSFFLFIYLLQKKCL